MKTMFALLLIAGLVLAAQCGPALAIDKSIRADGSGDDWWQKNLGRYLSARPTSEVPWLNHVTGPSKNRRPALPQFDALEPWRGQFADRPLQMSVSGQFRTQ